MTGVLAVGLTGVLTVGLTGVLTGVFDCFARSARLPVVHAAPARDVLPRLVCLTGVFNRYLTGVGPVFDRCLTGVSPVSDRSLTGI